MRKKAKGIFIVFEGPDRSGKTTQINLLAKKLKKGKIDFILTREPGGTPLSEKIRGLLLNPSSRITPMAEILLYEAARAQHVSEKILPALEKGKTVICDRFTLATLAYQGYGRKLPLETVKQLNMTATSGLEPDVTVVLHIPDRIFASRRNKGEKTSVPDRMESQNHSFRKRVNRAYKEAASKDAVLINANDSVKNIHAKIFKIISGKMKLRLRLSGGERGGTRQNPAARKRGNAHAR